MARIHPSEMGQAHAQDEKHHEHGREHHRQWEPTITRAASRDVGAVALSRAPSGGDPPSRLHQGDENRVMHGEQNGDPLPVTLPVTVKRTQPWHRSFVMGQGNGLSKSSDTAQYSLHLFGPDNVLRVSLWRLRASKHYQAFMLCATIACAFYLFLTPTPTSSNLHVADVIFCSVFIADCLNGVIVHGFWEYWRYDVFNKLDLVIAFLCVVDLALRTMGFTYSFKALRLFRIFKPMLALKAFAGIKAIFFSIVRGASSLAAIVFLLALSMLVFDVVGVEFYMGSARRRCIWIDSLEPVLPEKMCKRLYSAQVQRACTE